MEGLKRSERIPHHASSRPLPLEVTHMLQYGAEEFLENPPGFQGNSISYGTWQASSHGACQGTGVYQSLPRRSLMSEPRSEPWSAQNLRYTSSYALSNEQVPQVGPPKTIYSGIHDVDDSSLPLEKIRDTSVTSLNADDIDMIGSFGTLRRFEPSYSAQSQSMEKCDVSFEQKPSTLAMPISARPGAGILVEARKSTPQMGTPLSRPNASFRSGMDLSSLTIGSTEWLSIPQMQASSSEASSPLSSAASPSSPDILVCAECLAKFRGLYRKGNLARHQRHKHEDKTNVRFPCEDEYCGKQFNRQDARLTHYRRHHPHLSVCAAVPQGPQRKRRSRTATNSRFEEVASKTKQSLPLTTESETCRHRLGDLENAIPHCKVDTAESENIPVEGPTSSESVITEQLVVDDLRHDAQPQPRSTEGLSEQQVDSTNSSSAIVPQYPTGNDIASNLTQQTEQPGSAENRMDSTCAIQSPPSEYNGDGMTSRVSDFGIGYQTTRTMSESEEDRIHTDSDSLVWTEYSENTPELGPSAYILAPMKLEYIERLLFSFFPAQRQCKSPAASDQEGSDRSTRSRSGKRQASSRPSNNSSETRSPKRTKRQSTNDGDGNDQGGDDDGNDSHVAPPSTAKDGQGTCLLFACPFVKRYPNRYHKCYSYILKDVGRVKYHLFRDRVHRLPIYCPNCSATFSKEDMRDKHVRVANCTRKPQVKWEGITAGQREQLNKRSPSTNSAVENWNAVYRILFPSDPLPDSPYIDMPLSRELHAFREHILSEGPLVWNEILRTRLPENLRPYLEELQLFHRSFYPDAVAGLFERWNSSHSTIRSLQFQPSLSPIRQETEPLVDPTSTAAVGRSNSSLGSDSAFDRSVTDGSQSETELSPASQNGVPTAHTQQQSIIQYGPRAVFPPQQSQTTPGVPHSTPQIPIFAHTQNTNVPLNVQYPFGSAAQTEYGSPQILYQPPQVPTFAPSLEYLLAVQYASDSTQPDPEIRQFQDEVPLAGFPQGGSYQLHQMQTQPQFSYHMPTTHPSGSVPMGENWAPPEA